MNYILPAAKQDMLEGRFDWRSDPIFGVLINTGTYTFSDRHATLADIPPWARNSTSGTLANRTVVNGVAFADDLIFYIVSNEITGALALFNGTNEAARYVLYADQATNLPMNPHGHTSPIIVHWQTGSHCVFAL